MLDRRVVGAGVVLGDPDQCSGEHQAHNARAEQGHARALGLDGVVRHHGPGDHGKGDQAEHARHDQAFVKRRHDVLHARAGLHKETANDRSQDGHAAQHQRVQHRLHGRRSHHQGAQHHGGNQGHRIGFEQVGGHAGAVTHVVAHVVGNHGRVARIVFRDAGFNLAHQVGAYVSALGEDAAAQTREDGDQRRAKGQADQRVEQGGQVFVRRQVAVADQEPVEGPHAQQAQADDQHACDGAALEGHVQCRANAVRRGLGRAHVGTHRDVHADEAASPREDGPHDKANGCLRAKENADQDRQDDAHDGDGAVLARQVGRRTLLDGRRNFLHAGIASVHGKNGRSSPEAVKHGHHPTSEREK